MSRHAASILENSFLHVFTIAGPDRWEKCLAQESWMQTRKSPKEVMCVKHGKSIINHPPVITIYHHFLLGAMFTIPTFGWPKVVLRWTPSKPFDRIGIWMERIVAGDGKIGTGCIHLGCPQSYKEYHQSYIYIYLYIWVYRGFIWALDIYHIFRDIFRYRRRVQPTHEFQAQPSLHTYQSHSISKFWLHRFWSLGSLVLLSTQSSTSENGVNCALAARQGKKSVSAFCVTRSAIQGLPQGRISELELRDQSCGSMRFYEVLWDFGSFFAGFSMLDNAMCSYKKCEPGRALCDASLWWHTTAAASNMRTMAMDNCP